MPAVADCFLICLRVSCWSQDSEDSDLWGLLRFEMFEKVVRKRYFLVIGALMVNMVLDWYSGFEDCDTCSSLVRSARMLTSYWNLKPGLKGSRQRAPKLLCCSLYNLFIHGLSRRRYFGDLCHSIDSWWLTSNLKHWSLIQRRSRCSDSGNLAWVQWKLSTYWKCTRAIFLLADDQSFHWSRRSGAPAFQTSPYLHDNLDRNFQTQLFALSLLHLPSLPQDSPTNSGPRRPPSISCRSNSAWSIGFAWPHLNRQLCNTLDLEYEISHLDQLHMSSPVDSKQSGVFDLDQEFRLWNTRTSPGARGLLGPSGTRSSLAISLSRARASRTSRLRLCRCFSNMYIM